MDETKADVAQLTAHFTQWQGLRWVPVGASALLAAALLATAGGSGALLTAVLIAAALVVVGAEAWIGDYYERIYGRVRALRSRRLKNGIGRYAAIVPVAVAGLFDAKVRLPILLSGLLVGALMMLFWSATGRRRWHWPVLALAPIVTAFVPAIGLTPPGRPSLVLLLVVAGVVEIVGGILDHRMLLARIRGMQDAIDA